jgi:hypothetical protein
MAVVDALLEVGRQWDEIENLVGDRLSFPGREFLVVDDRQDADRQAIRFLEMLAPLLPDDSSVFAALERHSDRGSVLEDLTPYVRIGDFGRHPPYRMTRVNSTEQFALRVLRDRVVTSRSPVRRAARRETLRRLTSRQHAEGWAGLVVAVRRPLPDLRPPTPRLHHGSDALEFNPIEAFLQLPPVMQTTAIAALAAKSSVSLIPSFQFSDRSTVSSVAEETNAILASWRDPWGAGSWWVRLNGRLGAIPLDLLGTDREREIPPAAEALTSESF